MNYIEFSTEAAGDLLRDFPDSEKYKKILENAMHNAMIVKETGMFLNVLEELCTEFLKFNERVSQELISVELCPMIATNILRYRGMLNLIDEHKKNMGERGYGREHI